MSDPTKVERRGSSAQAAEPSEEPAVMGDDSARYRAVTAGSDPLVLGRGGMAKVVAMVHVPLSRVVAVKMPLAETAEARRLFEVEKRVVSRLRHPNIVVIHDAGWMKGVPFYAMDLLQGRTLYDALQAATTLEARLALLPAVTAIVKAVAHAHGMSILHRDLKPENIYLDADGVFTLIDWGVAVDQSPGVDDPYAGFVVGTESYWAPELLDGRYSAQSDVYALGVILTDLVMPNRPAPDTALMPKVRATRAANAPRSVAVDRATGILKPLKELPEYVELAPIPSKAKSSPELRAIIAKATARKPEDRYADAGELARDLEASAQRQHVSAMAYDFKAGWIDGTRSSPQLDLRGRVMGLLRGLYKGVAGTYNGFRHRVENDRLFPVISLGLSGFLVLVLLGMGVASAVVLKESGRADREAAASKVNEMKTVEAATRSNELAEKERASREKEEEATRQRDGLMAELVSNVYGLVRGRKDSQLLLAGLDAAVEHAELGEVIHTPAETRAFARGRHGDVAFRIGHYTDALTYFTESRTLWEQLAQSTPLSDDDLMLLGTSMLNQGDALEGLGKLAPALAKMKEAHAFVASHVEETPTVGLKLTDAYILTRVAALELKLDQVDDADHALKEAMTWVKPLDERADPVTRSMAKKRVAVVKLYQGYVALARKSPSEARELFQGALAIDQARLDANRGNARDASDVVEDEVGLSLSDIAEEKAADALPRLERAWRLIDELMKQDKDRVEWVTYAVKVQTAFLAIPSLSKEATAEHQAKLDELRKRVEPR